MADSRYKLALELLESANYCVALTGAGISTPSGIPDFRSPGSGLWTREDFFDMASLRAFRKQPEVFYRLIRPLLSCVVQAKPNAAHLALSDLQKQNRLVSIITQNIDNLHNLAGSKNVIELHGHFRSATCIHCYRKIAGDKIVRFLLKEKKVPTCEHCCGVIKPDIILMGEQIPHVVSQSAFDQINKCDLLLIAGSSLIVDPAASLPGIAKQRQVRIIIVNYQPTYADSLADVVIHDNVAQVLPILANSLRSLNE
jgi:NAD-dependent deacetylase